MNILLTGSAGFIGKNLSVWFLVPKGSVIILSFSHARLHKISEVLTCALGTFNV